MATLYKVVLSLHLIAVISWMAGILYLFRLFVNHTEEKEPIVMERFKVMERKLYRIITAPAMAVAAILGLFMLSFRPTLLDQPWMQAKLLFAFGMLAITFYAGRLLGQFANNEKPLTSRQLRLLNEVPTLLMIAIVFLVILNNR